MDPLDRADLAVELVELELELESIEDRLWAEAGRLELLDLREPPSGTEERRSSSSSGMQGWLSFAAMFG